MCLLCLYPDYLDTEPHIIIFVTFKLPAFFPRDPKGWENRCSANTDRFKLSEHTCSKLKMLLFNVLLKFQTFISNNRQYFLLKKCEKPLHCKSFFHFFNKQEAHGPHPSPELTVVNMYM